MSDILSPSERISALKIAEQLMSKQMADLGGGSGPRQASGAFGPFMCPLRKESP
jgi:hypothetical protein